MACLTVVLRFSSERRVAACLPRVSSHWGVFPWAAPACLLCVKYPGCFPLLGLATVVRLGRHDRRRDQLEGPCKRGARPHLQLELRLPDGAEGQGRDVPQCPRLFHWTARAGVHRPPGACRGSVRSSLIRPMEALLSTSSLCGSRLAFSLPCPLTASVWAASIRPCVACRASAQRSRLRSL